jgi:hypothetical protein
MTMWKPTPCQTDKMMIAGIAVLGSCSQATASKAPNVSRSNIELMRPFSWYMNVHTIETTTIDVTTGRK